MKIDHILCPTDFSDTSTHALEQAAALAAFSSARLTLLHVQSQAMGSIATVGVPPYPGGLPLYDGEAAVPRLKELARAQAAGVMGRGIAVDVLVGRGQPAEQIVERASAMSVDLIVIGTHGHGGFDHFVLGSVAEKVLRRTDCPVMTVPPRAQSTAAIPLKRILCPVDFSPSSLQGLATALMLAQEGQAALTILHVIEWPWHEPPPPALETLPSPEAFKLGEFRRHLESTAATRLDGLVPADARRWCDVAPVVTHGKAYEQVLATASDCRADLIVIGIHGRTMVDVLVFGSTTNHVVRQAACPVLTVRRPRAPKT